MQPRYRSDYVGEFVVLETKWAQGKKEQTREWIPNPIENHHISGRAACIGSAIDQHRFDFTRLQRHRGGLLGSKKLQTYGTGSSAKHMRLDFAVETNPSILAEIKNSRYSEKNIVYTTARNCISNPGEFYLIPNNPHLLDIVTAVYLAAFDGHQEIFLLGYTKDTPIENNDWHNQLSMLFDSYAGVKFFVVGEPTNLHNVWFDSANVVAMPYRDFIGYCDV